MIVIFLSNLIYAQKEFSFRLITNEDGLPQSSIHCMLQDKKGFLWLGTSNGLNRYDGYNFIIYTNDPADSTSISDNGIVSILEDEEGYIWIGTTGGVLNRFDRKTGIFNRYNITDTLEVFETGDNPYFDLPLPFSRNNDNSITAIAKGKNNSLWIGTWGKGLIRFDKKTNAIQHYHYIPGKQNGLKANRIKSVYSDNNFIWVGTIGDGLYKVIDANDNLVFVNYSNQKNNNNSLSDDRIVTLFKDKKDNLWIGTYGGGLNKLSSQDQIVTPGNTKFIHYKNNPLDKNSLSINIVTSIIQDKYGVLWLGTFGGGLDQFNPDKNIFKNYRHEPNAASSLSKNDILSLLEDKSGTIWVGAHLGNGLNKLERQTIKFKQVNRDANGQIGLNDDVVWAMLNDNNGNLWIGTYKGGLNKWDRKIGKFTYYRFDPNNPNSVSDNHIRSLAEDEKYLLIGTYNHGLSIYNKTSRNFRSYKFNPNDTTSLGANQVQSIFIDSKNNYWFGTFGGGLNLANFSNEFPDELKFKRYINDPNNPFSLSDDRVYTIYEDKDEIIWIGTFGGGLNKFDRNNQQFISYKNIIGDEYSLSDNRVMSIYEDKNGFLWVGTYGGGLVKFDKQKEIFKRYNEKNRLNSSVVYGILEDGNGNLWLSTDNGLFKFNMKSEQFTQYDLHDGLQSLEFSGGAYLKSKDGEMFFGGVNGFNYFYPDSIKDNYYVPPVVISTVRIFNELIKGEVDTINVSYDQNYLSVEFAALDYTYPQGNQYAYMLEGFENEWHNVDSRRRIANYTNLSPGSYVFHVRGSNNDGVWNNVGAKLYLTISPPFWLTWWFISLSVLAAAFVIYYLSTIRYRNLLTIEKLKSKLSADLHDNVGAGLTEISILSELTSQEIKNVSTAPAQKLLVISDKARMLVDNMSDIVWVVNPQRDSLYHLILRLKDSYSDLLNSMDISFGTVNIEKFAKVKLPMDFKQNLYSIFKEAVNNSIKHSSCKKIILEANLIKDNLEISLKDDGIGLDLEKIKYGNGIQNMKNRAKAINGKLDIVSSSDGTTITFNGKVTGVKQFFSFLKNFFLSR